MLKPLFEQMLRGLMVKDRLHVTYPDGSRASYGPETGTNVAFTIHDTTTLNALVCNPELALGEGYMNETLTLQNTRLDTLLRVLAVNRSVGCLPWWLQAANRARFHGRRIVQANTPLRARANVAHHYDISDDLYRLFLDEDMQYSCAYFRDPAMTLDAAQEAKKAHIAAKLRLTPDCHVLDIGCGWGGLALSLARDHGVRVTGVTLSKNQCSTAQARAEAEGLANRVTFRLQDYRRVNDQYDRIVSVGMLEHVGVPNYDTYFATIAKLLKPDGVALIHTIGRSGPPMPHSPWIHRYIFPGGYVPSLSELAGPMERSGLWQADIEVWRLHYARTIRQWRDRFEANRDRIAAMYDERFVRMFQYYFAACIVAFEEQLQAVYQFQLAHRRDTVPVTRDYLYD